MKISVIIPIYNIIDCLERCVMSVVAQTHKDLEIILVDDGSTDGTEKLVDELGRRDERIRVFHKTNGGSSSARNLGLKNATGDFIGFVDSDDYIEPDMYELLGGAVEKYGARMAQISRDEIAEDGSRLPDVCIPPAKELLISPARMMEELLMHRGDCSFCTRICSRELFENRSFPEGELNEDFKLLTDMLLETGDFPILPKQCYHVYYRMNSNSRRKDKEDFSRVFTDIVVNADLMTELVAKHYPELKDTALRFNMVQRIDYMLHIPISRMRRDNIFYRKVVAYIRKHWFEAMVNSKLTGKNKIYLTLFAIAPRFVRSVHAKKMNGRLLKLCAFFLCLLLCGCGEKAGKDSYLVDLGEETRTGYLTDTVKRGEFVSAVSLSLSYTNLDKINLNFSAGQGLISSISVKKGDRVKEGDELARLDVDDYEEALEEQRYELRMNELKISQLKASRDFELGILEKEYNYLTDEEKEDSDYEENCRLTAKNYNRQIEDCEDAATIAGLKIQEYEEKMSEGIIYAPADGVISICQNDLVGEYISPDKTVITMIRDEDMVFKCSDMELAQYIDEDAVYTIITGKGETHTEREVVPLDMGSWEDCMYFKLLSPDLELETGTKGEIWIELDRKDDALYVPNEAVHVSGEKNYVYTISEEGMRQIVYVTCGLTGIDSTEIVEGLKEGETVIVN